MSEAAAPARLFVAVKAFILHDDKVLISPYPLIDNVVGAFKAFLKR